MFQYSFTVHNYNIRNVSNQGLYIPSINTTSFGNKSLLLKVQMITLLIISNKIISNKPQSMFFLKGNTRKNIHKEIKQNDK